MKGLNLAEMKKIHQDDKSATFKHKDGHEIKVAVSALKPEMKKKLDKLPVYAAEGYGASGGWGDDQVSNDAPQSGWIPNTSFSSMFDSNAPDVVPNPNYTPMPKEGDVINTGLGASDQNPGLAPEQKQSVAPAQDMDASSPAPAPQAQPRQPAAQAPQQAPQPTTPEEHAAVTKQNLTQEDLAWQQDLQNGHVQPKTYQDLFANKDTLGKIGTIFGLMVGGAGAGLTHQPNALLEMMNKQIQNDLEAQMKSKENAVNYIKLNQQHQMNQASIAKMGHENRLIDAETNAKALATSNMQMNRAALHQMTMQVQKLPPGTPQRQQAENTLAMMFQAVNNENFGLADRAAAASALANFGNQSGGSQEQGFQQQNRMLRMSGNEKLANDNEEKHFPGLPGKSSVPLTSADRDSINSGMDFDQKLHRFIDWTKSHSGDISPTDRHAGQAMAAELQGAYRQATHGGVYKEGEQNFISKLIDSEPTKFFNEIRVVPQLNAIASENQKRVNQLVQSKGFPGYQGARGAQSSSPDSQYKMVGGVKYMRGPNGEAIKVK